MTPIDTLSPAEQHRVLAADFATLLDGVESGVGWDAPTPVTEWRVQEIPEHLVWFHDFVHAGSPFGWTRRRDPAINPIEAWAEQSAAVQLILDDPAQAGSAFSHPRLPPTTLGEAVQRFYLSDVFMHSWDLARATGQDLEFDPAYAERLLAGMRDVEDTIRSSGQYGSAHPVADDAPAVDRLMAFVGRDPHWTPAF